MYLPTFVPLVYPLTTYSDILYSPFFFPRAAPYAFVDPFPCVSGVLDAANIKLCIWCPRHLVFFYFCEINWLECVGGSVLREHTNSRGLL